MTWFAALASPKKWKRYLLPLIPFGMFLLVLRVSFFSNEPLFLREQSNVLQGQVPNIEYYPSGTLYLSVLVWFLFLASLVYLLGLWARYYLNRKLALSYLLFALIPILATSLIFGFGLRAWAGLSTLLNMENSMEMASKELEFFVTALHSGVKEAGSNIEYGVQNMMDLQQKRGGLLQNYVDISNLSLEVYYLSEKIPNEPRNLVSVFLLNSYRQKEMLLSEDTREFDEILPSWLDRRKFSDIVSKEGRLLLQHIQIQPYLQGGDVVIIASMPFDRTFLEKVRETNPVNLTISDEKFSRYVTTQSEDRRWYWRWLMSPLSSRWDLQALNWTTGYYWHYGEMSIGIEPDILMQALGRSGSLNLFHVNQKQLVLKKIVFSTFFLAMAELIAMSFGLYLVRYISRSLNFIAVGHEKVAGGVLDYYLPFLGRDQLGAMGRSFNSMVENIRSLLDQVANQQRYKEELRIARDIQMSLLPNMEKLAWCKHVAATCIPAREVGGDYYEILRLPTGQTGIFIADVSGKGTSAAFYMAELKGVLLALREKWSDPRELMLAMNEILQPALKNNVFISAAYLLLCHDSNRGRIARAGHCPAFHLRGNGELIELMPPGMAIGLAGNQVFGRILKVEDFDMEPGDKVVLYTDGLDEMTHQNEMYGIARLKELLVKEAQLNSDALKDAILKDVLGFLSTSDQNDDLTLVIAGLDTARASSKVAVA